MAKLIYVDDYRGDSMLTAQLRTRVAYLESLNETLKEQLAAYGIYLCPECDQVQESEELCEACATEKAEHDMEEDR